MRALALVLLLAPRVARAQDASEALIREGVDLRAQGRDADALERFRAAWAMSPTPRARGQVGWAAQALGRWREAELALRESLSALSDPWVASNRDALSRSLAEVSSRLGDLSVACDLRGARVIVDGELLGTTPLASPLRAPVGTVNVRVEADGFIAVTREAVRIRAGEVAREEFSLTREPTPVTRPDPTPEPRAEPHVEPPARPPVASQRDRSHAMRYAGYTLLGVASAGAVTGAVILALREGTVTRYSEGVRRGECAGSDLPVSAETSSACRDDRESMSLQAALGWTGVGLAAASAGVGVALLIVDGGASGSRALRCAPWAGAGVTCAIAF